MNKWTKEKPVAGWWWCRGRKGNTPFIIQIEEDDEVLNGYEWCKVEYPDGYDS